MNDPIMISPHEIFNVFLAICGAIITISAAAAIIIKIIGHFREPDKKQNDRITQLESDVKDIRTRLAEGDKMFDEYSKHFEKIEDSVKKTNKIIIESLQVLIEHGIDGNNIDGMKGVKKKIDNYLLEK